MRIGYAFYGNLYDNKIDKNGNLNSTPNGNAIYSWSIIRCLQQHNHRVFRLMPNLDKYANEYNKKLFIFATKEREKMMRNLVNVDSDNLPKLDLVLLEWRWPIYGKNTSNDINKEEYTPDLKIQEMILEKYAGKVIVFDLDYKMTEQDINDDRIKAVFELGYKNTDIEKVHHVEIPFDFREMKPKFMEPIRDIIYIGNRYERDNSIDEYLYPLAESGYKVQCYGNWLEKGRNSKEKWPKIDFGKRLQVKDFNITYGVSRCTILLVKEEYYKYSFMTMRILESILFGCLPIGLSKFKEIERFLPEYLIADDIDGIIQIIEMSKDEQWRRNEINKLVNKLRFMDVKFFYDKLMRC